MKHKKTSVFPPIGMFIEIKRSESGKDVVFITEQELSSSFGMPYTMPGSELYVLRDLKILKDNNYIMIFDHKKGFRDRGIFSPYCFTIRILPKFRELFEQPKETIDKK